MADGAYVAVAGEVLTDLVPAGLDLFRAAPGGSPANVAVGLARLGVPTRMVARLADDALGRRLRGHLERNDVDLSWAVSAAEPSSLAIVTLAEDGSAEYNFRVDGTADWQWSAGELERVARGDVAALHVGSLAMTMDPGAAVLRRLVERLRASVTICFDPNVRPMLMGEPNAVRPRIEELVELADVVKASADDVEWLYPGVPLEDVVERWHSMGPLLVVVTRGPDGALSTASAARLVDRPGVPVEVADTVGAGDSFMSALIAGLYHRQLLGAAFRATLADVRSDALAELLDEAVRASAITCSRVGADPPRLSELRAHVHRGAAPALQAGVRAERATPS